jgi:hypothetical protein
MTAFSRSSNGMSSFLPLLKAPPQFVPVRVELQAPNVPLAESTHQFHHTRKPVVLAEQNVLAVAQQPIWD